MKTREVDLKSNQISPNQTRSNQKQHQTRQGHKNNNQHQTQTKNLININIKSTYIQNTSIGNHFKLNQKHIT